MPNSAKKSGQKTEEERRWCFGVGLGKDDAHEGSEGSKPGVPKRAAKSPPHPHSLNFKPQCSETRMSMGGSTLVYMLIVFVCLLPVCLPDCKQRGVGDEEDSCL